jgi:hypothetical protein
MGDESSLRVQGMVLAPDLSGSWLNVDGSAFHVARVSFLPLTRFAQDFDICSRNFTDGAEHRRYLPNESVEKGLSSLDTLALPSRDHIW